MIESLDEDDGIRRRDLAAAIDLVVVSVDASELARLDPATVELLLDGAGEEAQVCWHAFGSAAGVDRDLMAALVTASQRADRISMLADDSARWWTECGGRPPAAEVPHPAVLARRVFSREVLERRIEFLRAVDAWPHEGRPIVVQGCRDDLEIVERLAAAAKGRSVVAIVADSANGDSAFADAVVANVESAFLLPDMAGTAPTEDRVAAIAGAGGVLAASSVVRDVARSFEVPSASLHEFATRKMRASMTTSTPSQGLRVHRVRVCWRGPSSLHCARHSTRVDAGSPRNASRWPTRCRQSASGAWPSRSGSRISTPRIGR